MMNGLFLNWSESFHYFFPILALYLSFSIVLNGSKRLNYRMPQDAILFTTYGIESYKYETSLTWQLLLFPIFSNSNKSKWYKQSCGKMNTYLKTIFNIGGHDSLSLSLSAKFIHFGLICRWWCWCVFSVCSCIMRLNNDINSDFIEMIMDAFLLFGALML